ncbi:MAG: acyltransferase [Flavobacteriaceae bacterium]|nr:acyltransferase [Flavobacteriaceae bacterium]
MKFKLPQLSKEYRPELNGLRALAVLLVLFFHLDFDWMQGGFLGVDVFLVISGYFISRNILNDLQQGTFSFLKFYTKRLRRLFPALLVTLLLVLVAGYFWLTPSNFERLGQSTLFSSISLSNLFFWNESGYFNVNSETKPLLHMWSLSLEEQFYLFWPLLLTLFFKFLRKYLLIVITLFVIVSVVLGELYVSSHPDAVFFLIPFRMFEFLLGASCIWLEPFTLKKYRMGEEFLFLLGLALILYTAVVFDSTTRMPGLLSLIPCVGAMLIIYAGKAPSMSWLLKNKVVELIGKSSYSIYLVHWPILVYYKYVSLAEFGLMQQVVLGIISIGFGLLMWYFIENTFRYPKRKKMKMDRVWVVVPSAVFILCICAAFVWKSEGVPSRYSRELYMSKEEILANRKQYWKESKSKNNLLKGIPGKGHVLVLGNSHAIDLIYALRYNGLDSKITSLQSSGKCYNFGTPFKKIDEEYCLTNRTNNLKNTNWAEAEVIYLHDHWPKLDIENLRLILSEVRKRTSAPVFVFGPKMVYKEQVPEIIRSSGSVIPDIINEYAKKFAQKELKESINEGLKKEFRRPYYSKNNIHFIDLLEFQGGDNLDQFEIVSNERLKFLYFDASHLTEQGARELGSKIKEVYPYLFDISLLKNEFSTKK